MPFFKMSYIKIKRLFTNLLRTQITESYSNSTEF